MFRDKSKGITLINQSVAIEKLAGKLDLLKSNPVRSPTIASPLPPFDRESKPPPDFDYLSAIGSLLYRQLHSPRLRNRRIMLSSTFNRLWQDLR